MSEPNNNKCPKCERMTNERLAFYRCITEDESSDAIVKPGDVYLCVCEIDTQAREIDRLERANGLLVAACETFTEMVSIPERNCSCHLSPPCRDCEEYGGLREADKAIAAALAASKEAAE